MVTVKMFCLFICVVFLSATTELVQTRYVFETELQRQVSQHKLVATWDEAKQRCESEEAMLASPISAELLKYMKSIISANNHTTPHFIGIKIRRDAQEKFASEENILLEDVAVAMDMVEQLDLRDGECLSMDAQSIRSVPCWIRLPYICYTNVTEETTTTEQPTTVIPDCNTGYKLDKRTNIYYKLYKDKYAVSWDDANSTCSTDGGNLSNPNSIFEGRIAMYNAFPIGTNDWAHVWIGLRDSSGKGDYISSRGEPIKKVIPFERSRGEYNCVVLRFDGKLESWPCFDNLPFICEKNELNMC